MPTKVRQALEKEKVGQVPDYLVGTVVSPRAHNLPLGRQLLPSSGHSVLCRATGRGWFLLVKRNHKPALFPP